MSKIAREQISSLFDKRYPIQNKQASLVRENFKELCRDFLDSSLADSDFANQLCSGDENIFWQRFSEALFWNELRKISDIKMVPLPKAGGVPDFHIKCNHMNIWVECICPKPGDIPTIHLRSGFRGDESIAECYSLPHEEILQRWTAAIKEKYEKFTKYKNNNIIGSSDVCVIAINGCLLRGRFHEFEGISQFPYAFEAVYPVGPVQVTFYKNSSETETKNSMQFQFIKKKTGSEIEKTFFIEKRSEIISAIWAIDERENYFFERSPSAIIHNAMAKNKLPEGLLPTHDEYVVTESNETSCTLLKRPGFLHDNPFPNLAKPHPLTV